MNLSYQVDQLKISLRGSRKLLGKAKHNFLTLNIYEYPSMTCIHG